MAFARTHFGAREFEVEVGMFGVARRVFGMLHVERAVVGALRTFAVEKTVALRGAYVGDETLLGLEVEGHLLALVLVRTLFVDGFAFFNVGTGGVAVALGVNHAAVHVHGYLSRVELHVEVLHVGLTVEVSESRLCIVDHGVLGGVFYGRVDARFAWFHGVDSRGIGRERVGQGAVAQGVGGSSVGAGCVGGGGVGQCCGVCHGVGHEQCASARKGAEVGTTGGEAQHGTEGEYDDERSSQSGLW